MRPNRIKQMWSEGKPVTLGWLSVNNSFTAEVMARQGFDALCIDLQHGTNTMGDLVHMLQAVSQTDTVPVVRVPWNDPSTIMKALDYGAYAIIVPLVNNAADAAAAVAARTSVRKVRNSARKAPISCIRSRSIWRSSVSTNMAASDAVTSDNTASPSNTTMTANAREAWVVGTKSPYPTVAAVVKASHMASARFGVRGSSNQKPSSTSDHLPHSRIARVTTNSHN